MKIIVDTDNCIASGACVLECPRVFDQDENGLVVLLLDQPPAELFEGARRAMAACPAAVIQIVED